MLCLVALAAQAQTRAELLRQRLISDPAYVMVVAHRGDWRNHPENSLAAIRGAIEQGVDMVEIDIQCTKDSILVLSHDETLDRCTNGHGRIQDHTYNELADLKLRAAHAGCLTRNTIPTLQEALELCRGEVLVNIDKGYQYFELVLEVMEKTGTMGQVVIKSRATLDQLLREHPSVLDKVIYMPVVNIERPESLDQIKAFMKIRPVAVECDFPVVNAHVEECLKELRISGIRIWMNALWPSQNAGHDDDRAVELGQPHESWGWLLEQGATIIQSDRPAALVEYLRGQGRRPW